MATRVVTTDEIKALQRVLATRGLYAGEIDGLYGALSRAAVRMVQEDLGHEVTGLPTLTLLIELGVITPPMRQRRANPITGFFTSLLVRKGAELFVSNLKGLPLMNLLNGYKTYILAALIILCSLGETFLGVDVPGYELSLGDAIMVALGLFTARIGAKNDAKAAGQ
jgi:hypothetical protein